ncbi:Starch-binding associating with outer membrane [Chitinophaga costaii]|uniref:Starch-binding associating with outer membrane n=2 Tax=Chitinophaga costaii TaxID=1335309 RepID=A0A1C4DXM7_9BACT|nr:Starch-binding associating with outer membrane [Chitinophaga costaii]
MNRYIKNIGLAAGISSLVFITGCKKFLDVNDNPNGANTVQESLLLSYAELNGAYNITGGYPARTCAFWTQQIAYNAEGPDWDSYQVLPTDVNNTWQYDLYPGILKNLKLLETEAQEKSHFHYLAIAKILLAYNLAVTTDLWGNIPYSDAFKGIAHPNPSYDTQEQIYTTIGTLLDDGIANAAQPVSGTEPADDDFLYNGDMDQWTKFAYLLKARYALRLSYAPGKDPKVQAQAALDALTHSFTAASDAAAFPFSDAAGSQSPWYQLLVNWGSILTSSTFIDRLKASSDPRLPLVAKPLKDSSYVGRVIGSASSLANTVSELGDALTTGGSPVYFATYDEALFIKAEATYLIDGFAAAQPILKDAVTEDMIRLGLSATNPKIAVYLNANTNLTAANAYETIMNEKYISNYLSLESFNDWRRTGFPKLNLVMNPYNNLTAIPRRWYYASSEVQTNPQPGQDVKLTDRLWWDTK